MLVPQRFRSDVSEEEGLGGWDEKELEEDGVEGWDGAGVLDEGGEVDGEEFELGRVGRRGEVSEGVA